MKWIIAWMMLAFSFALFGQVQLANDTDITTEMPAYRLVGVTYEV